MTQRLTVTLALLALFASVAAGCGDDCRDVDGVQVCGEFGDVIYRTEIDVWEGELQWPPVVQDDGTLIVSRGDQILTIDETGTIEQLARADSSLSAPSRAADGTLYAVASNMESRVMRFDGNVVSYSGAFDGTRAFAPPTITADHLYVNTTNGWDGSPSTSVVDTNPNNFEVVEIHEEESNVAVTPDETLRFLEGAQDCWDPHEALVAKTPSGEELWRFTDPSGVLDFAPGGDGETYVVTGDRGLVRVSPDGDEQWRFNPSCELCTVAASPTVTEDRIYFPVWEGWVATDVCQPGLSRMEDAIDPLYALTRDGDLLWTYDGFTTESSSFELIIPTTEKTHHHPSGRPAVAADGTLFAAADGAVVTINHAGKEIGRALYDASAGEREGGWLFGGTWYEAGISPAPVLGPDGTLYVWDGTAIWAFATGKPAADIPWVAPFGGTDNDSRTH